MYSQYLWILATVFLCARNTNYKWNEPKYYDSRPCSNEWISYDAYTQWSRRRAEFKWQHNNLLVKIALCPLCRQSFTHKIVDNDQSGKFHQNMQHSLLLFSPYSLKLKPLWHKLRRCLIVISTEYPAFPLLLFSPYSLEN